MVRTTIFYSPGVSPDCRNELSREDILSSEAIEFGLNGRVSQDESK
jgi:hypothetical protein